jgi:hypothetical protein
MTFGPDNNLYVSSRDSNSVLRYDGTTGLSLGAFVSPGSGGLSGTEGLLFGTDGSLYVSSGRSNQVLRYDGQTGAFLRVFASGGGLNGPRGLNYGPDGNLYVSSFYSDSILRYNGQTGAFIDTFVSPESGGLSAPTYMLFHDFALHIGFSGPSSVQAGTPFALTVTVQDAYGHQAHGYTGTVHFVASNGAMATYTFTPADMGTHTFTLTLFRAATLGVTGTDTVSGISGATSFTITPAAPDHIELSEPASVTAGMPFPITVTVQDQYNNAETGYTGTVHFTATNGAQPNYTFQPADLGTHTFTLTLTRAATLDLTATDSVTGISGTTSFTITPAAADHLVVLQQPMGTMAGQTISPVVVAVVDQYGNVETGDNSDTVTLSLGVNPSSGTLGGTLTVTVNGGIATFSDLSIDRAGVGYSLHVHVGGGLPDLDSDSFTITM